VPTFAATTIKPYISREKFLSQDNKIAARRKKIPYIKEFFLGIRKHFCDSLLYNFPLHDTSSSNSLRYKRNIAPTIPVLIVTQITSLAHYLNEVDIINAVLLGSLPAFPERIDH